MKTKAWRLKPSEVRGFRNKLLKRQGGRCGLCFGKVDPCNASLDHDHESGYVRSVLHTYCDSIEGRIRHEALKSGMDPIECLEALIEYWKTERGNMPMHPNHKPQKTRKRNHPPKTNTRHDKGRQ